MLNIQNRYRLPALAAILVLALLAHNAFVNQALVGYLWLAIAGILLVAFAPPLVFSRALFTHQLNLSTGKRFKFAAALMLIGTLLMLDAARLFATQLHQTLNVNDDPWNRFIPGLILWIVGSLLLSKNKYRLRPGRLSILLILILCVAVFLRVYLLDVTPTGLWYDEAAFGLQARQILHNWDYRPILVDSTSIAHLGLYAITLGLFGETNYEALRLVQVAFSVGSVIMAYVVGRQLRGHYFGLLMALVLAAMRWSITFSRNANNGVEVVFFSLLAFYLVIRLVRYGQMRDAVLAGLSAGIGFWFYRSFQAAIPALGLFVLLSWKYRPWKKTIALVLTVGVNALAVMFPIVIFALVRPAEYFDRVNVVSIFTAHAQNMPVPEALATSIPLHLEMFHIKGDMNGRHNLPGEPMLDPVTGILFGLGLIFALRNWRKPEIYFFYGLLIAGLSGGILTLTFEAPQALRTIPILPSVTFFTALGALALGQTAFAALQRLPMRMVGVTKYAPSFAVLVLAVPLVALNYDVYFLKQRFNYYSWMAYSTTESLVGRILAQQGPDTLILTSPFIFQHVSIRFLAEEEAARSKLMKMPDILPVRVPPTSKVLMILVPGERMLFEYAQQLYPKATFRIVSSRDYGIEPPANAPDLFYTIELKPNDIASVQGLAADGTGIFYAPDYRQYHFVLPEGAKLTLNQQTSTTRDFIVRLPTGNNYIKVDPPDAQISWIPQTKTETIPSWMFYHTPVALQGVRAAYYANGNWTGEPVTVGTHPFIYQQIQILPMDRPYSVIYSGQIYAPQDGNYTFYLNAIDNAELSIDHSPVTKTPVPNKRVSQSLTLTEGWHDIEVRFQDVTQHSFVTLEWTVPASKAVVPVPMQNFRPFAPGDNNPQR